MKYNAILSRTTTDKIKSRIMSPQLVQLVLDVYMTPQEYADILGKYYETDFSIEVKGNNE